MALLESSFVGRGSSAATFHGDVAHMLRRYCAAPSHDRRHLTRAAYPVWGFCARRRPSHCRHLR